MNISCMRKFFVIVATLFATNFVHAQTLQIDYNSNCQAIYNQISALQLDAAKANLLQEANQHPTNAAIVFLANYIDFYELFFNEDPILFQRKKVEQVNRLAILENTNANTPYYLYAKGIIYLQWGMIKLKQKSYMAAAKDVRKSYQLFAENKKLYPSSIINDTYMGALQSAIGTIPSNYKWVSTLFGMKGNLATGISLLQNAVKNTQNPFAADALFFYTYVKTYLQNEPKQAYKELSSIKSKAVNNRLLTFMLANLAINQNKAQETITIIQSNYNKTGFLKIPILDYELGTAHFYGQNDNCLIFLNNYVQNFKGSYYKKDACYKMAMYAYEQGNMALAKKYAALIGKMPSSDSEADKMAQQFYESPQWPNIKLLQLRQLHDGGYFTKALSIANVFIADNSNKTEFYYRKARLLDEMQKKDSAIVYYKQTIDLGKEATTYFAARAALQLGMLYEDANNFSQAKNYYSLSRKMKNEEYKNSIDMRAKAGLQRVGS